MVPESKETFKKNKSKNKNTLTDGSRIGTGSQLKELLR